MQKLKLLWLTENYPPQRGGMAQSCDRIIDGLRKRRYDIDIIHFINRGIPWQCVQQMSGSYMAVPVDESEAHTLNCAWNSIQDRHADAIVCFGGYLPVLAAPVYASWLDVPLITMIRGNDFDNAIFTPRKRDILRDAVTGAQEVTVVTRDKTEKLKKLFPGVNTAYIPNGIDCSAWVPSRSEIEFAQYWRQQYCSGKICIGLFGELKTKKGVKFFVESLLGTEALNNIHFLMIGDINDDLSEVIAKNSVSFSHYPFLDRYELIKYYLCCDALAIPSFYDGMPNVLLEAGALGIPVLASRIDGMKDVIRNADNGLLFEPGNSASCRKAIFDLLDLDAMQRNTLGENLKKIVQLEFNINQEIDRYEKIFDSIINSKRNTLRVQH